MIFLIIYIKYKYHAKGDNTIWYFKLYYFINLNGILIMDTQSQIKFWFLGKLVIFTFKLNNFSQDIFGKIGLFIIYFIQKYKF